MALAVALMLGAPDHWAGGLLNSTHHHGTHEQQQSTQTHTRHCHGKAATCTDLPLTGGSGIAALDRWLAAPTAFVLAAPSAGLEPLLAQTSVETATPPPRA